MDKNNTDKDNLNSLIKELEFNDNNKYLVKLIKSLMTDDSNNACRELVNINEKKHSEKAFEALFYKYHPVVHNFLKKQKIKNKRINIDVVEDLSQEVFTKILTNKAKINTNCEGWIYTVSKRVFFDYCKRKSTRQDEITVGIEDDNNEDIIFIRDREVDEVFHPGFWWECFDKVISIIKKQNPEYIEIYKLLVESYETDETKVKINYTINDFKNKLTDMRSNLKLLINKKC